MQPDHVHQRKTICVRPTCVTRKKETPPTYVSATLNMLAPYTPFRSNPGQCAPHMTLKPTPPNTQINAQAHINPPSPLTPASARPLATIHRHATIPHQTHNPAMPTITTSLQSQRRGHSPAHTSATSCPGRARSARCSRHRSPSVEAVAPSLGPPGN